MLRSFDAAGLAEAAQEMADPWYGDDADFERTYAEVVPAARGVVEHVRRELDR